MEWHSMDDMILMNRDAIRVTGGGEEHGISDPNFLLFTDDFVRGFSDVFDIALAYCTSLMVHHPFLHGTTGPPSSPLNSFSSGTGIVRPIHTLRSRERPMMNGGLHCTPGGSRTRSDMTLNVIGFT